MGSEMCIRDRIEAFFILPAHLRHLDEVDPSKQGRLMRFQTKIANSLVGFAQKTFRPFVAMLIKFRYITVSVFIGLFVMSIMLLQSGIAPSAMIPEVEGDMISFNARFPEGTNYERIEQVRSQVDTGIKTLNQNALEDFGMDFKLITEAGTVSAGRSVQGFLGLSDPNKRPKVSSKDIADKLEEYVGPIPDA